MTIERRLHDASLHAPSAPMYHANLTKACLRCRVDVGFDDGWHVARREDM